MPCILTPQCSRTQCNSSQNAGLASTTRRWIGTSFLLPKAREAALGLSMCQVLHGIFLNGLAYPSYLYSSCVLTLGPSLLLPKPRLGRNVHFYSYLVQAEWPEAETAPDPRVRYQNCTRLYHGVSKVRCKRCSGRGGMNENRSLIFFFRGRRH